ncbi:MAG: methylenetetrahydrofolate reductase C-terminal domain-containing protein [Candidatus Bipolaricaulota bacterium]|nr:MAG: methylenetetrahydrofolate reductase C-terminal domain-containing protein [Candidatus Bipolaricaulota bacterium]
MLVTERKPVDEIVGFLDGEKRVFLLGCDGCAAASGTGGEPELAALEAELAAAGVEVVGRKVVDFLCQKALIRAAVRPLAERLRSVDSVVVSTCGIGIQAAATVLDVAVHPACNTLSLGGIRGEWQGEERCLECGQCFLDATAGICPLTACAKQLVNGPCGGAKDGSCEVEPEVRRCAWDVIYERLERQGRVDLLRREGVFQKDYAKMRPPTELRGTRRWAIDLREEKGGEE